MSGLVAPLEGLEWSVEHGFTSLSAILFGDTKLSTSSTARKGINAASFCQFLSSSTNEDTFQSPRRGHHIHVFKLKAAGRSRVKHLGLTSVHLSKFRMKDELHSLPNCYSSTCSRISCVKFGCTLPKTGYYLFVAFDFVNPPPRPIPRSSLSHSTCWIKIRD